MVNIGRLIDFKMSYEREVQVRFLKMKRIDVIYANHTSRLLAYLLELFLYLGNLIPYPSFNVVFCFGVIVKGIFIVVLQLSLHYY